MSVDKIALRLIVGGDASGAKAALKGLGSESGKLGGALKAAQAGAAVGLTAIVGLGVAGVNSYKNLTAAVASLQRQSKISAEDASLLVGQWQRYGVSIEAGTRATVLLSKGMDAVNTKAKGSDVAAEAFGRLGISLEEVASKSPADMLETVRQKLNEMPPGAERTAIAAKLMGRGFMSMSKWIGASSTDLDALNQQLKDTGQVMNEAELAKAKDDLKQMALLQVQWRGILVDVGRSAMPLVSSFTSMLSGLMRVLAPLAPQLKYVALGLAGFLVVSKISAGINAMTTAFTTLKTAALAARSAIVGRWGGGTAMTGVGTPGVGARPLAPAAGTTGSTAAEQRNTAAVNQNTAATQRSTAAANREAAASNREAAADSRSVTASNLETAADRRSAAASSLAGTRIGGMGTKASRAATPIGQMGVASGRAKGSILGMDKSAVKSAAGLAGLAVAVMFTMNQLSKLGNAIDQMDAAAKQAEGAKNDALSKAEAQLERIRTKYGADSPQYAKMLKIIEGIRAQIARDAYKKPWWASAASKVKGGIGAGLGWAFGGGQAAGGDYMVKRPTLFLAGEKGAERATFTPQGKAAPGGGKVVHLHLHIGNFIGTDAAAARQLGELVKPYLAGRYLVVESTGF